MHDCIHRVNLNFTFIPFRTVRRPFCWRVIWLVGRGCLSWICPSCGYGPWTCGFLTLTPRWRRVRYPWRQIDGSQVDNTCTYTEKIINAEIKYLNPIKFWQQVYMFIKAKYHMSLVIGTHFVFMRVYCITIWKQFEALLHIYSYEMMVQLLRNY